MSWVEVYMGKKKKKGMQICEDKEHRFVDRWWLGREFT